MSWLSLALALVQLVNWVFTKLDAAQKEQALRKLIEDQQMKDDLNAIAIADHARSTIGLDPDSLRAVDPNSRT